MPERFIQKRLRGSHHVKAAVLHAYGDADQLRYEDIASPNPGAGEVAIQVAAAGVNFIDTLERSGATKDWNPLSFPAVLGWDVSGTVTEIGEGVTSLRVGDRVCGWVYHTYAERCVAKAELFAKTPDSIDVVAAAALPLVCLTASQLLSKENGFRPGQRVLVSGALGAVGRIAMSLARMRGAASIVAGVRGSQVAEALELDADEIVALDDSNAFVAFHPVDFVANTLRGKPGEVLLENVKAGGTFATITGTPQGAGSYPNVAIKSLVAVQNPAMLRELLEDVRNGRITIPVAQRMPLRDAALAHAAIEKGSNGKILLLP